MSIIISLLLVVSLVTGLAWWADRWLGNRTAERDFMWRSALAIVAAAPLLVLAQNRTAFWRWSLPNFDSVSEETVDLVAAEDPATRTVSFPSTRETSSRAAESQSDSRIGLNAHDKTKRSATPASEKPADVIFGPPATSSTTGLLRSNLIVWTIVGIWGTGTSFSLLRIAVGLGSIRRLVRPACEVHEESILAEAERVRIETGLRSPVRLASSSEVSGPVVAGVIRPCILLPAALLEPTNRADLRIAIRHECAHIVRHDPLTNLLLQLVVAAYWFHPLVRLMQRAMGQVREDLCDNQVLAGESAVDYAETLLRLALDSGTVRLSGADLGVFGSTRRLDDRVEGLLSPDRTRTTRAAPLTRSLVIVSVLLLTLATISIEIADAEGPKTKSAPARTKNDEKPARAGSAPLKPTDPARPAVSETVQGTVVDRAGGPVAKADVYLLGDPSEGHFILPTHPQKTATDENGKFRFDSVAGGSYRVWAESGNRFSNGRALAGERLKIEGKGPPEALTLKLIEGCRFRVTVRSLTDDAPIKGAAVRFRWPDIERRFDTGDDGTVLIEGVRPAEHVLEARAEGYAVGVSRIEKTKPETTTNLEFKVGPGGTIRGTVRDSKGKALAGAGIEARVSRQPAELDLGYRKTDQEGRFEIPNVPFGETARISISKKDFVDQYRDVTLSGDKPSQGLAFLMQRRADGGSIAVEVVGPDDRPVAEAELVNPGASSNLKRTGRTDTEGRCRLDDVYESLGRFELNVKAKGLAPKRVSFEPGRPEMPTLVRVKLEPGHRIRARVQLPDGKPAAKVWVFHNEGEHGNDLGGRADTDENGRFEFDSLPSGSTFTVYSPKGFAPFKSQRLPLDGEKEVVVTLEPAGLVRGRVLDDATGKVLVPYRVRIMVSQNRKADEPAPSMLSSLVNEGLIITGEEGRFEFGDLPPKAPMQLIVSAEGYEPTTIERVLAETSDTAKVLDVRLKKIDPKALRDVTVRLLNAKGEPHADAHVRLWTAADAPNNLGEFPTNWFMVTSGQLGSMPVCREFHSGSTDKEGRVTFRKVRTADFAEVAYWGTGLSPGRTSVDIDNTPAGKVSVELKAAAPSELIVEVDREAWPNAGAVSISAILTTLDYEFWTMKPGETRYVFRNLPAGKFTVSMSTPSRRVGANRLESESLARRQVELKAGESTTVRFEAEE